MPPPCLSPVHAWALILVLVVAGCAGDSDGGKKGALAGAGEVKNYSGPKPKKENLPVLPNGAGKMDDDARDELTPTKSGLYYRILRKSKGRHPGPGDVVLARYRGTLDNGKEFDSSYEPSGDPGEPREFALNQVISGWTEGLQLVGEGGMIELDVRPGLGYGATAHPTKHGWSIPANARLHFIIELVKVQDSSRAAALSQAAAQ